MMWIALWFALVLAAVAVFGLLGRRLFHQAKALTAELSTASERLAEVSQALESLGEAGRRLDDAAGGRQPRRPHEA